MFGDCDTIFLQRSPVHTGSIRTTRFRTSDSVSNVTTNDGALPVEDVTWAPNALLKPITSNGRRASVANSGERHARPQTTAVRLRSRLLLITADLVDNVFHTEYPLFDPADPYSTVSPFSFIAALANTQHRCPLIVHLLVSVLDLFQSGLFSNPQYIQNDDDHEIHDNGLPVSITHAADECGLGWTSFFSFTESRPPALTVSAFRLRTHV